MLKKTLYCLFFLLLPCITKPFVSYYILEKDGKKIVILGTQKSQQPLESIHENLFLKFITDYNLKPDANEATILLNAISCFSACTPSYDCTATNLIQLLYARRATNLTQCLEKKKLEQPNSKIKIRHFEPRIEEHMQAVHPFLQFCIPLIDHMPKNKDLNTHLLEMSNSYLLDHNITVKSYLKTLNDWHQRITTKWLPLIKDSQSQTLFKKEIKSFERSLVWAQKQFANHTDKKLTEALFSQLKQSESQEACMALLTNCTYHLLVGLDYNYLQLGLISRILVQQSKQDIQFVITDQSQCISLVRFFASNDYYKHAEEITNFENRKHKITPAFTSRIIRELNNVIFPESKCSEADFRHINLNANLCPCGNKTNLQKCSGCQKIAYCSRGCQKKDWKQHKTECKQLAGQE